jgi:hypothetical protein
LSDCVAQSTKQSPNHQIAQSLDNQQITKSLNHQLSLPLFVFLVAADHAHDALAAHDLALVANPSH